MKATTTKSNKILLYLILVILISIPIFTKLSALPFREYDEARLATNAYEMHKNGNWLVTYFHNAPEMWNTKPPFLIWLQVICIKLLGFGELAIRLPIAIAAFLTCILLFGMCAKYLEDELLGFIAAITLASMSGFIHVHISRTGDYDGLLIFFITPSSFWFFVFLETKQNKFLYFFFLTLALGVLTKSVAALLFSPAIFIYCVWQKQLVDILKNKHFYFSLSIFLFIAIGYYLLREHYNPGYIKAVQQNELGGRFLHTLEYHKESFWFYYNNILKDHVYYWILIPCGLLIGLSSKDKRIVRFTVFITLIVITFFLIISKAQTKLDWYSAPLFPFLALLIALFIRSIVIVLTYIDHKKYLNHNVLPIIFLFLVLIIPYQKVVHDSYLSEEYSWDVERYRMSYYLKSELDKSDKTNTLNNFKLLYQGWGETNLYLYIKMLQEKGINVSKKDHTQLSPGDSVVTCSDNIKSDLSEHYNFTVISEDQQITKYNILSLK